MNHVDKSIFERDPNRDYAQETLEIMKRLNDRNINFSINWNSEEELVMIRSVEADFGISIRLESWKVPYDQMLQHCMSEFEKGCMIRRGRR